MRRPERASYSSVYQLLRSYMHTSPRRRTTQVEPKSDKERQRLGLPLREPWFETMPFDEKKKVFVLRLKDILQAQPKKKMEIADLGQLRQELDVVRQGKQRKIATYVRRFPAAFTLRSIYTLNNKKKTWCSFSADALKLLDEEARVVQDSEALLVQKLRKLLMISMKNRLPFATVKQVRESLGLPVDFKESLVNKYPDVFLLKERKGSLYLELKAWDESLAISAVEKRAQEGYGSKMSKKNKRQRSERLEAEGEGHGQEYLCRKDNEQSFSSRDEGEEHDDEHMISIDKGEACGTGSLCKRGHQQRSSPKEEVDLTDGVDEDKMCSVFETKGCQQATLPVEAKGCETKTLAMTDNIQQDTPFLLKPQVEPFQNEALHTPKSAHRSGQYLSSFTLENNITAVSAVELKTCSEEIQNLCSDGIEAYQQGMVFTHDFGLENGQLKSAAATSNTNLTHSSKLSTASDCDPEGKDRCHKIVSGDSRFHSQNEAQAQSCEGMDRSSDSIRFPWKNKRGKLPRSDHAAEIEDFQSAQYIAPYRNSRDLELPPKSCVTEKFVVGVLHEYLSLTIEKRATLQHLELFCRPYRLPSNLLDFLLKYDGIFYVVRGRTKSHVFLKEAYKESVLLEKDPLLLWQQRFVELAFSTSNPVESKPKKGSLPQNSQSLCSEV